MTAASQNYRVVVPVGVTLMSEAGAESTIVMGEADMESGTAEKCYCGPNAKRCVYLSERAKLKGVTLTGGHTEGTGGAVYGGAVTARTSSYVLDSIITNNYAGRAAMNGGTAIRCRFENNRTFNTGNDLLWGNAFNCVFGNMQTDSENVYGCTKIVNCTFYGNGYCTYDAGEALMNCVVLKPAGTAKLTKFINCALSFAPSGKVTKDADSKVYTLDDMKLDADYRPRRFSPLVNAGKNAYYTDNFPAALLEESSGTIDGGLRIYSAVIDIGAFECNVGPHWYVDSINGDDSKTGRSKTEAFRTLQKAFESPELAAGDTVHAAPGVYSNGVMEVDGLRYRVAVPSGVALVADDSAQPTVIMGKADTVNGSEDTGYCGSDALRCVRLGSGASIRGFTLTGGHTPTKGSGDYGAAVRAVSPSYMYDCVVTNNTAGRAAVLNATAIRCHFSENYSFNGGNDVLWGSGFNCLFGDCMTVTENVYGGGPFVNCTFVGNGGSAYSSSSLLNCIVLKKASGTVSLERCAMNYNPTGNVTKDDSTMVCTLADMKLDADYRPLSGSTLIDAGSNELYKKSFPEEIALESSFDGGGGHRVYNAAVDIGAYEYDSRGDCARALRRVWIAVAFASSGVTVAEDGVRLSDGDRVELALENAQDVCSFVVENPNSGTVTVWVDGEVLLPVDGRYTIRKAVGSEVITVKYEGVGSALLGDVRSMLGFKLLFR
jgi:hypothetical protein